MKSLWHSPRGNSSSVLPGCIPLGEPRTSVSRRVLVSFVVVLLAVMYNEIAIHYISVAQCAMKLPTISSDDVRVVLVGDLHLLAPWSSWVDRVRREWAMTQTLSATYRLVQPDAVFVLGDIFDEGARREEHWTENMRRFRNMFWWGQWQDTLDKSRTPVHAIIGNHDRRGYTSVVRWFEGEFGPLARMVHVKSTSFTLLDYAHPERAPEGAGADGNGGGSHGSIVMVHVPLYRPNESLCRSIDVHTRFLERFSDSRGISLASKYDAGLHVLDHACEEGNEVLRQSHTEELLERYSPRAVFSAHTHYHCEYEHEPPVSHQERCRISQRVQSLCRQYLPLICSNDKEIEVTKCQCANETTLFIVYGTSLCIALAILLGALLTYCRRGEVKHD